MEKITKCPVHRVDFQLIDRGMRCPVNGCHHFVDVEPSDSQETESEGQEETSDAGEQSESKKSDKKSKKKK